MNLPAALDVCRRITGCYQRMLDAGAGLWTAGRDVRVTTTDGENFSVLTYCDDSDCEQPIEWGSWDEWDVYHRGEINRCLNPNGAWSRRTIQVVNHEPAQRGATRYGLTLSCGHSESWAVAAGYERETPPVVGALTECGWCCEQCNPWPEIEAAIPAAP